MAKVNVTTSAIGLAGSVVLNLFGGWNEGLTVLCIFMVIDFITGILAALLSKSPKTTTGTLSSDEIFKGIVKKLVTLVMVVVGAQLDKVTGQNYIRDAVVIAYIITETISIIENAGLIGLPVPSIITKVIDVLKQKSEGEEMEPSQSN